MTDEPTAWEDINPGTALARRDELRSGCLARLAPATNDQFRDELEACLALVVPVGMDEAARAEWLAVAWETLKHLPADLLSRGCAHARETADHPSKIVPAIMAETRDAMDRRRDEFRSESGTALPPPTTRGVMDRRGEAMSAADTAELNESLERLGATARYREDGSRYFIEKAAA